MSTRPHHLRSLPSSSSRSLFIVLTAFATLVGPRLARAQEPPPAGAPAAPEGAAPTTTPAAPEAPGISPELAARLDELDQRTRILDRKLELAQEAAAQKPAAAGVTADEKGFTIASPDHAYELRLHGHIQFDARRVFDSNDPTLPDKDTFLVRRARPILDATVLGLVDFKLVPDFGNNTTAVYDAYLDVHPTPWLRLRGGKFKPPIGLERLQADNNLVFPERALDSNLSAQRDVGLELWGDIAHAVLHYELAIFNGNADGTINDIDSDHAKTYAGRLFLRPFQAPGLGGLGDLGAGFAIETGNEKGSSALTSGAASNTWLPTFKSVGQNTIFTYLSSTTDLTQTVFAQNRHTRVNPQLYYYVGPFGLLGEWLKEYQDVAKGATTATVKNQAGHVTVSWAFGGDNGFDGVRPHHAADWATKQLGAVEVAFRYSWLDVDDAAFGVSTLADPTKSVTGAQDWGVGLNWWLSREIKVSGAWEDTTFTEGAGKAKAVAARATEKMGFARLQVAF
jgi:phosphate-selective porin OprO and OprP